jgi:hypothetical protein
MNIQEVRDMALITLRKAVKDNESFMPVAFLNEPQTAIVGCPFDDDTKVTIFKGIGAIARQRKATELFLVTDSWIRIIDPKKEDAKWILDNWDIEKPTMFPEKLRQDCLVISQISFSDQNKNKVLTITYDKKNGEVVLKKEEIWEFNGIIKEAILEGYNNLENDSCTEFTQITP